jgi:N-ethylmaleimide reductase
MPKTTLDHLFSPVQVGRLSLKNRMIMAPMTCNHAGEGDVATPIVAEYYRQLASAGLIITEGSQVSVQGKGSTRSPGIFSAVQIAGWKQVTEVVHAADGRIFLQLWHAGRLSHPLMQPNGALPVAPSAIKADGEIHTPEGLKPYESTRALSLEEIPGVVAEFRQAAENAKRAGFDGVEIHCAEGYLVDQFLRDGTNLRTDAYGGSVENRARFLKEVVESVIEVFGASRVGVRLSPISNQFSMSDSNPQITFRYATEILRRYGLAYLHVVQLGEGSFNFVELKRRFRGIYIANGRYGIERATTAIRSNDADLVVFGNSLLAHPDLVERFNKDDMRREGAPLLSYQDEERGYADYPTLADLNRDHYPDPELEVRR